MEEPPSLPSKAGSTRLSFRVRCYCGWRQRPEILASVSYPQHKHLQLKAASQKPRSRSRRDAASRRRAWRAGECASGGFSPVQSTPAKTQKPVCSSTFWLLQKTQRCTKTVSGRWSADPSRRACPQGAKMAAVPKQSSALSPVSSRCSLRSVGAAKVGMYRARRRATGRMKGPCRSTGTT